MTPAIPMRDFELGEAELAAEAARIDARIAKAPRAILTRASDISPEPIKWFWPGWLAAGKLHVLAGAPGTGKSTVAFSIAAAVSAGGAFPDGFRAAPGDVLIWSGEDDARDTIVPRFMAAGADLSRIHIVRGVIDGERRPFDPATDAPLLAEAAARLGNIALVIVDPLVSAVAGDSHKNAETRRGLQPLVDLGQQLAAVVLGITHYTKATNGRDPVERVTGSLAFGALARIVLGTARQQANGKSAPRHYTLARAKSNIGPDGGGFAYGIESTTLAGGICTSRIAWGEALAGTARELLTEAEPDREGDGASDAANFLCDLLHDGPLPAKSIFAEAAAAGYSRDQMHRAKKKLGVAATKTGMAGGWVWRLRAPEDSPEDGEDGAQKRPPSSLPSGSDMPSSGPNSSCSLDSEVIEL